MCRELGLERKELCEFDAIVLQDKLVRHPVVTDMTIPIILDKVVATTEGTACLHSAPGCGPEDYLLGIKHDLEIFSPLAPDGTYTADIKPSELEGMKVTDGQIWVIKDLARTGKLVHKTSVMHSYPHCWRCRNGLMFSGD